MNLQQAATLNIPGIVNADAYLAIIRII